MIPLFVPNNLIILSNSQTWREPLSRSTWLHLTGEEEEEVVEVLEAEEVEEEEALEAEEEGVDSEEEEVSKNIYLLSDGNLNSWSWIYVL